jgi:hypothetical protein
MTRSSGVPDWNGAHRGVVGRHRAQGLSGPARRYALIVLTLALTSSLPILAAFGSGSVGDRTSSETTIAGGTTPFIPPPSVGPVVVVPLQPGGAAGVDVPGTPPEPVPLEPVSAVPAVPPAAAPLPPPLRPAVPDRPAEPADDPPAPEASPAKVYDKPARAREQKKRAVPHVRPSWEATIADQVRGAVPERIVIRLPKPTFAPPPVEASWDLIGRSVREDPDDRR